MNVDADTSLIDGITSTLGAVGDVQKEKFDFDLVGNLTALRGRLHRTTFSESFGSEIGNR